MFRKQIEVQNTEITWEHDWVTVVQMKARRRRLDLMENWSLIASSSSTDPFAKCEEDLRNSDLKYYECVPKIENGDEPCYLLKEMHRAKDFRTYFLAILPVIFSVIALVLNIIYLVLHVIVFRAEKASYRKRALFLLSRSVSSVMALLLLYVVIIVWKAHGFHYGSVTIFILIGAMEFLSITGTYVALCLLLYTAITRPIIYKTRLRMRHCVIGVSLIWLFAVVASICFGLFGGTLFYPDSAPITCSFDHCQRPLAIVVTILLIITYSTVLCLYFFLIFRLRRGSMAFKAVERTASTSSQRLSLKAMNRLSMNVITFAIGNVPIVVVLVVAISNLRKLSSLGEGDKTPCKTFLNAKLFVQVEVLASCAAAIWLLAMIIDPIINVLSDPKLRNLLLTFVKKLRRKLMESEEETNEEGTNKEEEK
ncbi:unnamed protein product, partial [Mesorhabditis belari]|uniref:G-protein coupled receptors family 1 profile domain-containing protein n=1 Tax=Mesorhabditis belari TaxID=2138241 RepID=A0AAF3E988_9BILA